MYRVLSFPVFDSDDAQTATNVLNLWVPKGWKIFNVVATAQRVVYTLVKK